MKLEELLLNEEVRKFIEENIPDEQQRLTLVEEHLSLARQFQALVIQPFVNNNNNNLNANTSPAVSGSSTSISENSEPAN